MVKTQHLVAIAAYDVRFENFYTASPVCMPNRASFMTSRYPRVHGLRHNGCVLPASANIFVDVLAADGYKTAAIGKSHLQLFFDNPQDWRDVEETGFGRSLLHRLYPRPLARILRAVGGAGREILPFLLSRIRITPLIHRASIGICKNRRISN